MSGDLLPIEYNNGWSTERLHDCVYDTLPSDIKPDEKWKIMLFLKGDWIMANKESIYLSEGDVLDMVIETGIYNIDFPLEDYKSEVWSNILQIRGSVHIDLLFYVNEITGVWYFKEEIDEDSFHLKNLKNLKNDSNIPNIQRVDAHELINTLDLSLCVKEYIYSKYVWCYSEILPKNAPRPNTYYCDYKWEEHEGKVVIDNSKRLINIDDSDYGSDSEYEDF